MPTMQAQATPAQGTRRAVLITGCSEGGMGDAVARDLHATGRYWVFASTRSVSKMASLPSGITKLALDVTSQESVDAAVATVLAQAGHIDVLINNAGVNAGVGPTVETSLDKIKATYEVNVFGVIRVTQAVAGNMIDYAKANPTKAGMIVNIGSTVGVQPMPWSAAYNSSKAAIHSYSDTLRMELAPLGIRVQVVAPGKIQSHFGDNGSEFVGTGQGSRFQHVWDLVKARANYSQEPSPAPMPTDRFAQVLRSHMEFHGALGQSGWAQKIRDLWSSGSYLFVGPMSRLVWLMSFLPWRVRDTFVSRKMKLQRIAQSQDKKNV